MAGRHDSLRIIERAASEMTLREVETLATGLLDVAHALAGGKAGHGPAWQAIARRIGCSAERCITVP